MSPIQADRRVAEILEIKKAVFVGELPGIDVRESPSQGQVAEVAAEQEAQLPGGSAEEPVNPDDDLEPPKKKARSRRSAKPARTDSHQDSVLKAELDKPLTVEYRGLIRGSEEAVALCNAYERHLRRDVPMADEDPTFPATDEMRRTYVKQLCEAIMDTSQFQERDEALQKLAKLEAKRTAAKDGAEKQPKQSSKRKRGEDKPGRFEGLNATDSVYVNPESTPADILRAAARCNLTNVEVEILS